MNNKQLLSGLSLFSGAGGMDIGSAEQELRLLVPMISIGTLASHMRQITQEGLSNVATLIKI
jgi:hypothetical protein